jgi:cytochrome b involved in lipid metabolism
MEEKGYTKEEVAKHNTMEDGWIIIDEEGEKKVYDITTYIPKHPGGDWSVSMKLGDDSTYEFNNRHRFTQYASRKHSEKAQEILKTLCIGKLIE